MMSDILWNWAQKTVNTVYIFICSTYEFFTNEVCIYKLVNISTVLNLSLPWKKLQGIILLHWILHNFLFSTFQHIIYVICFSKFMYRLFKLANYFVCICNTKKYAPWQYSDGNSQKEPRPTGKGTEKTICYFVKRIYDSH